MSDLISRQDAIEAICTWDKFGVDERGRVVQWHEGLEPYVHLRDVVLAIEKLPSAERTGRWTYERHENAPMLFKDRWICSACGKTNYYGMSDFCPCCGAMMENSTRRLKEAKE